jgi:hypothetical protein
MASGFTAESLERKLAGLSGSQQVSVLIHHITPHHRTQTQTYTHTQAGLVHRVRTCTLPHPPMTDVRTRGVDQPLFKRVYAHWREV